MGRHLAAGIVAVGQGDHDPLLYFTAFKKRYSQTDGIAKSGFRPGHPHLGLLEQLPAHFQILGKGNLNKSGGSENQKPYPVSLASGEKLIQHLLDGGQTVHSFALLVFEVFSFHGTGQIHGQKQVTGGYFPDHRWFQPLWLGQGHNSCTPDNDEQQRLHHASPRHHRTICGSGAA